MSVMQIINLSIIKRATDIGLRREKYCTINEEIFLFILTVIAVLSVKELYCGVKSTNRNHFSVHFPFIQCKRKIKRHKHQYYLYSVSDLEMYDCPISYQNEGCKIEFICEFHEFKSSQISGFIQYFVDDYYFNSQLCKKNF